MSRLDEAMTRMIPHEHHLISFLSEYRLAGWPFISIAKPTWIVRFCAYGAFLVGEGKRQVWHAGIAFHLDDDD